MLTCPRRSVPSCDARAVRMVAAHREGYPSVTAAWLAVAKQLGLGRETVRCWVIQAEIDSGGRAGMTSAEHAEIKRLKGKNRRLREDVQDAGNQYTSIRFTEHLALEGIAPSIGSVADAHDNGLMETIIGQYTTECVRPGPFHDQPFKTIASNTRRWPGSTGGTTDAYTATIEMIPPTEHKQAQHAALEIEMQPVYDPPNPRRFSPRRAIDDPRALVEVQVVPPQAPRCGAPT
jgi:hypothetical protein